LTASDKHPVMNNLTHWKAEQARACGTATWQNIADRVLPVVDKEHVARRATRRGDRWLDVAAVPRAVALPAARAGAEVSALDLPPAVVHTVRPLAARQGLSRLAAVHQGIRACRDQTRGRVARQARDRKERLVGYFERRRQDRTVRVSRPHLLIVGRRRAGGGR
jgi:hypothetical protein